MDYTAVDVSDIDMMIYRACHILLTLAYIKDVHSKYTPEDISRGMETAVLRIEDIETNIVDHAIKSPDDIEIFRCILENPHDDNTKTYLNNLISDIMQCVDKFQSIMREIYDNHIRHIMYKQPNSSARECKQLYSQLYESRIEAVYQEMRKYDIMFGELYWSFTFKSKCIKEMYAISNKFFWAIIDALSHITNTEDKEALYPSTLYIRNDVYDSTKCIKWHLFEVYQELSHVLRHDEWLLREYNSNDESDDD